MRFDEFELDEANAQLTRAGQVLHLPPKAFSVLCVLAAQAGRLVRKDDLFDAVWGHKYVSDSVLKTAISQLRTVLADDAAQPRFIETVARLGYRFIAQPVSIDCTSAAGVVGSEVPEQRVITSKPDLASKNSVAATGLLRAENNSSPASAMIGREPALMQLQSAWEKASVGQSGLLWVAGDAGVGKSTLIEHFVLRSGAAVIASGQCVEQYGAGEPYLPVLQALGTLARTYEELPALMRVNAPTWFIQMPWLASENERAILGRELIGTSHERMVREFIKLLELFTQSKPLLLITEDLHWGDHATLRLMDYVARSHSAMKLLWISSFRLTQVIAQNHPLQTLRHELKLHRLCDEILLDSFSEAEVAEYLATRLSNVSLPEAVIRRLHQHTDGLPLFLSSVIDSLLQTRTENNLADMHWLRDGLLNSLPVPEDLSGTLDRQIEMLDAQTGRLLEVASACGAEFRAGTLANILDLDLLIVCDLLDVLVRRQIWVRHESLLDLPDGAIDTVYAFRHVIYKHAFYRRLGPSQRVQLHRRVVRALVADQSLGIVVTPVELAYHYEQGREFIAALTHYVKATELALGQFAPKEAEELCRHGLQLLPQIPDGQERQELELMLLAHLATACSQLYGISSNEAREVLIRAQDICGNLPLTPQRALLLISLGWNLYGRAEYASANALGEQVHALGRAYANPVLIISACNMLGIISATCGHPAVALEHLKEGLAAADALGDALPKAPFFIDPRITMRSVLAVTLVSMGLAEEARAEASAAIAAADALGRVMARCFSRRCATVVEMRLRNPRRARVYTEALGEIIAATGLVQPVAPYKWMHGWVEAHEGNVQAGLELIKAGYAMHVGMGMMTGRVEAIICLIDVLILNNEWEQASTWLEEARTLSASLGEDSYLPDLEKFSLCIATRQVLPLSS